MLCLARDLKATTPREGRKRPRAAAARPRTTKGALPGPANYATGEGGGDTPNDGQEATPARVGRTQQGAAAVRRRAAKYRPPRERRGARRGGKDAPRAHPWPAPSGAPRPAGDAVRAEWARPSLAQASA